MFLFMMCAEPSLCFEDYPIHTVTGLVKQWLRELPDPLMTFMHYNEFLHAVGEEDITCHMAAFSEHFTLPHTHYNIVNCLFNLNVFSTPDRTAREARAASCYI